VQQRFEFGRCCRFGVGQHIQQVVADPVWHLVGLSFGLAGGAKVVVILQSQGGEFIVVFCSHRVEGVGAVGEPAGHGCAVTRLVTADVAQIGYRRNAQRDA
jgi:hypothetical protein